MLGECDGACDTVGSVDGLELARGVGSVVRVGGVEGEIVGSAEAVGRWVVVVGCTVGEDDGVDEGDVDGAFDGEVDGLDEGDVVGTFDGDVEGAREGGGVAGVTGDCVGPRVGDEVVGEAEGGHSSSVQTLPSNLAG